MENFLTVNYYSQTTLPIAICVYVLQHTVNLQCNCTHHILKSVNHGGKKLCFYIKCTVILGIIQCSKHSFQNCLP